MLKPFTLGKHIIDAPVVLAPLSGITDLPFRLQVAGFGAGYVVSEMIPGFHLAKGSDEARLKMEGKGLPLHVVQLAGCDPHWMREGVKVAEQAGANVIDINMGCPSKKVTGGTGGSALMREPELAIRLVEATVKATNLPVTLKMRLGWDFQSLNAAMLAKQAEDVGVQLITVHGRTRQQFYKDKANWALIKEVREAISLPLLVNGDIIDANSAREALTQSGADGVMIGRAAQGKPWLLNQIAASLEGKPVPQEPSIEEKAKLVISLYEAQITLYGEPIGIRHARKHLSWGLEAANGTKQWLKQWHNLILTNEKPKEVIALLEAAYKEHEPC